MEGTCLSHRANRGRQHSVLRGTHALPHYALNVQVSALTLTGLCDRVQGHRSEAEHRVRARTIICPCFHTREAACEAEGGERRLVRRPPQQRLPGQEVVILYIHEGRVVACAARTSHVDRCTSSQQTAEALTWHRRRSTTICDVAGQCALPATASAMEQQGSSAQSTKHAALSSARTRSLPTC